MSFYLQWFVAPALLMALLFYAMGADRRFARRLRSDHPEIYRQLGRPLTSLEPFSWEWWKSWQNVNAFMRSDEVETLGDPVLAKLKKQGIFFGRMSQVYLLLYVLNSIFGWYP